MTTKEYLNQVSRLNRKIQNRISELSEYKELAYGINAINYDEKVQSSMSSDRIGNALAKIEKMENELNDAIDEYADLKSHIVSQIENMENENYFEVLFSRYIEKKSFEKIADEMSYTYRHITRLHGNALVEFEKKYGKEYIA